MLLIGSRALDFWKTGKIDHESDKDWDFILTRKEGVPKYVSGSDSIDPQWADVCMNHYALENFASDKELWKGASICSMEGLAAIKRSHLWRDHDFNKHIAIYHNDLKPYYNPKHDEFVRTRAKLIQDDIKQRHPKLNKTNEDFFDDAVDKVYDHDTLHELVAYGSKPLYTYLKYQGREGSAWCEKDLWDKFSHTDKIHCVAEEVYVIATERFLVPKDWEGSVRVAFMESLRKVCTTLTSGWFRDFAIDNYPDIVLLFNNQKFMDIKEKLKDVPRV